MIRPTTLLPLTLSIIAVFGRPDPGPWWSSAVPLSPGLQEPRGGRSNGRQIHSSRQGSGQQSLAPPSSYGAPRAPPIAAQPQYGNDNSNPGFRQGNPNNVLEIAVRRLKTDVDTFMAARARFLNVVRQMDGFISNAEFKAVLTADESFNLVPNDDVYVWFTSYENLELFRKIEERVTKIPEYDEFLQTIDVQCFHVLEGVDGTLIDVDGLPFNPQLIELAIRNVKNGQLEKFDQIRGDVIDLLSAQEGVGRSDEYEDVTDANLRVGTTLYDNEAALMNAAAQLNSDPRTFEYYNTFDVSCYYILERIL